MQIDCAKWLHLTEQRSEYRYLYLYQMQIKIIEITNPHNVYFKCQNLFYIIF